MRRPFPYRRRPRRQSPPSAQGAGRFASGARHVRRLGRAFNPVEGIPHPFPSLSAPVVDLAVESITSPAQERAMRNLWWDGFFAECADVIWLQYFSLYAVALGAGIGVVGLLAAISNLVAALALWPGAVLAERTRRYKFLVLATAGGPGRLAFLTLAVIPWIATGNTALTVLAIATVARSLAGNLAMPAWGAFAAEFVPEGMRGRYFSSRNFARQVADFATAPIVGFIIYRLGGLSGWQVAWLLSFLLASISSAFYFRIPAESHFGVAAPKPEPARTRQPSAVLRDRNLLWLVATTGLFQLSVMIAGPFFSIYLVKHLGASTAWVGITYAAMPLAGIISQPILGRLNDRYGPKWLLVVSGLLLPIAPWLWMAATAPWHIILINVIAGVLWAANLLATFNIVLQIAPADKRPSYMGWQQSGIFFASFLGPLIGGFLIAAIGFRLVFFFSGAGRLVATLVLWKMVSEAAPEASLELPKAAPAPG